MQDDWQILHIFVAGIMDNAYSSLTIQLIKGGTTMKPKKKMHDQEGYELDNYLNEEDDRYYEVSSNTSIWYN